ncbi:MAG: tetratricopeptide repeat protein [Candidatus Omnitrophota bacterium]
MKNNLRFGVLICGVLLLTGCESRIFKAEKEMWRANKAALSIYRNPKSTPPMELKLAQDNYRTIMTRYPGTPLAVQAQVNIGNLYMITGDSGKARQEYSKLITNCEKMANLCAEATFLIGNTYEIKDQWPQAMAEYRKILSDYPLSSKSLEIPIYVIRHERRAGDPVALKRFAEEAAAHYYSLKSKIEGGKGGYLLQSLVARAYIEAGQWQDALDNLDKLARDFPENNPEQALWIKALIYGMNLQDKDKAKLELEKIVKDYPQTKLAKQAEELLKKL